MKIFRSMLFRVVALVIACLLTLPALLPAQTNPPQSPSVSPPSPEEQEMDRLSSEGYQAYTRGHFLEAIHALQAGLAISKRMNNNRKSAAFLNNLGNVTLSLGQANRALDYFQQALTLKKKFGNPWDIQYSLMGIGNVYGSLGQYEKALDYHQQALAIQEKTEQPQDIGKSLNNIGLAYYYLGQYEKALDYHQRALALFEKVSNPQAVGMSLSNIGAVYSSLGRVDKTLEYELRALALREKTGNPQDIGRSLGSIGLVYYALGQYEKSLAYYQRALALFEKTGNAQDMASALTGIGEVYRSQGQYDTALKYHQRALMLFEQAMNPQQVSGCLNNIGIVYGSSGKYAKALAYFQRALAIREKIGNQQEIAASLADIGNVYYYLGQGEKALFSQQRALAICENLGHLQQVSTVLNTLGNIYYSLHEIQQAEAAYRRGIAAFEKFSRNVLADPTQLGDLRETSLLYTNYALFLTEQHRPLEALSLLESGRARGIALQLAASQANVTRLFTSEEAAQLHSLKVAAVTTARTLAAVKAFPVPAEQEERNAYLQRLKEAEERAQAAHQQYELYRTTLYNKYPQFKMVQGERPRSAQEILELSTKHPDTLYLEFAVAEKKTLLCALQNGVLTTKTLPLKRKQAGELVLKWREAIDRTMSGEPKRAQELYTVLLQPIHTLLARPKVRRLTIVADGALLDIPFSALVDRQGKRLVEQFAVSNALSLGILLWEKNVQRPMQSILCIADTRGAHAKMQGTSLTRGGFRALPLARKEGERLAGLYPNSSLLMGGEAREATVKAMMGQYALLHFAVHGDLDTKNSLRSALVLADEPEQSEEDGFLDGREIVETGVSAKLAVLSACQSAQGKKSSGEGLMGLAWAFRAAGCPAVVASQWKVEDAATRELMVTFYQGLQAKMSKDDALRKAMLRVKKVKSQPYYWAAFQIIGETSPLAP